MAKKKFEVTSEILNEIEELAGNGLTQQQIHNYYGISNGTWYSYVRENPEIAEAIKRGKSKVISEVAGLLVRLALEGNLTAAIFYLKTQAGWREVEKMESPKEEKPYEESGKIDFGTDPIEAARIYKNLMSK